MSQYRIIFLLIKGITVAFLAIVMLLLSISCSKEKKEIVTSFSNRDSIPVMDTKGMSMLISDSGITRYRVKSERWLIFDRERDPFWLFPEGIYVEQFDSIFRIEASIEADTAYYYTNSKLWELRGGVEVLSREGNKFYSEELFWNERAHLVYSEKEILIKEFEGTYIYGDGFESNENMTDFHVKRPHDGEIYIKNDTIQNE